MVETALTSEFQSGPVAPTSDPAEEHVRGWDEWSEITQRMAHGDRDAFREYYDHFFEPMLVEAKRCTGRDEQSCLDVVHDAMLKAIRSMKPMPNQHAVSAWSRILVRSVSFDWLRRERRGGAAGQIGDRLGEVHDSSRPSVEPPLDIEARLLWLEDTLRQMPPDMRRLIDWRFRLGWTLRRIGERLGLKPGAVDGRIRRAINELKILAEKFDDG